MQTNSLYSSMEPTEHGITCVHNYAVSVSVDKQWFLFTLSRFSAWIGNSVFPTFMWSTTQVAHVETTKYPHPTPHPPYCSTQPPYKVTGKRNKAWNILHMVIQAYGNVRLLKELLSISKRCAMAKVSQRTIITDFLL